MTEEQDQQGVTPPDEPATPAAEGQNEEQVTRAGSSSDATPGEQPPADASEEPVAEEPVSEEPVSEEPVSEEPVSEEPVAEEPVSAEAPEAEAAAEEPAESEAAAEEPAEAEADGAADGSTRAPSDDTGEAVETAPVDESAAPSGAPPPPQGLEPAEPRAKPEIPGADLEPVYIPEEEQYLDAEAQAAAEAEAEAEAARMRAEAEDIQSKPIADAAIDLAAGARYTATGKRKSAVARVILKPGNGSYVINDKPLNDYFPRDTLQRMIRQPLESVGYDSRMDVVARMHGGGVSSQAGALRHGISRALIVADPNLRGELKRRGFLTRDPRVKERKKAGLKKARKRPQFSKR